MKQTIFISSVQSEFAESLARPVYLAGYIEQLGTGTTELVNRCTDLGLRSPEFYQNESFRTILWRKTTNHDSDHSTDLNDELSEYKKLFLARKSVHYPIRLGVLFWLLVMPVLPVMNCLKRLIYRTEATCVRDISILPLKLDMSNCAIPIPSNAKTKPII